MLALFHQVLERELELVAHSEVLDLCFKYFRQCLNPTLLWTGHLLVSPCQYFGVVFFCEKVKFRVVSYLLVFDAFNSSFKE